MKKSVYILFCITAILIAERNLEIDKVDEFKINENKVKTMKIVQDTDPSIMPLIYSFFDNDYMYILASDYSQLKVDLKGHQEVEKFEIANAMAPVFNQKMDTDLYLFHSGRDNRVGIVDVKNKSVERLTCLSTQNPFRCVNISPYDKEVLLGFPLSESFANEVNVIDSLSILYLIDFSSNSAERGHILSTLKVPFDSLAIQPTYGGVSSDGRIFVLSSSSKLYEINENFEINYEYPVNPGFGVWNRKREISNFAEVDLYGTTKSLTLYHDRYIVCGKNESTAKREIGVWDTYTREFLGTIDIGPKILCGNNTNSIFLLESIKESELVFGVYQLGVEAEEGSYLSMLTLTDPDDVQYSISAKLPEIEDTLLVFFAGLTDCMSQRYIAASNNPANTNVDNYMPFLVCYTDSNKDALQTFINSQPFPFPFCLNTDVDEVKDLPYAALINSRTKILMELSPVQTDSLCRVQVEGK